MPSSNTGEPEIARAARRRLDAAWSAWCFFETPPPLVQLGIRIEVGNTWLAEHASDDPQRPVAVKTMVTLKSQRAARLQVQREVERAQAWQQLEDEFLSAERDYLSIVGNVVWQQPESGEENA